MIGADTVKRAIPQAGDDGFPVRRGAQRRVHLQVGIVGAECLLGQSDVVRRRLSRDVDAVPLRPANKLNRHRRADVLQVDMGAGVVGEDYVARDYDVLGGMRPALQAKAGGDRALVHDGLLGHGFVLTMVENGQVEHLGVFDGPAHDLVAFNAEAVVRNGDDPGLLQRAVRRELLALHADGDAAGGIDMHRNRARGVVDQLNGASVVGRRGRVGHADDRREAAGGGSHRAGKNGFLVGLAGFAEMHVNIHEARADDEAGRVNHRGLLLLRRTEVFGELAVDYEDIALAVPLGGGINDSAVRDDQETHDKSAAKYGRIIACGLRGRSRLRGIRPFVAICVIAGSNWFLGPID